MPLHARFGVPKIVSARTESQAAGRRHRSIRQMAAAVNPREAHPRADAAELGLTGFRIPYSTRLCKSKKWDSIGLIRKIGKSGAAREFSHDSRRKPFR